MFMDAPPTLLYVAGGAFLLGWIVAKIGAYFGNKFSARQRDPRDDRIRSLDAEVRVAQTAADKAKTEAEERDREIEKEKDHAVELDATITDLHAKVGQLKSDLKDSVKKTRELRAELTERATENLKSAVELRDAQTELSVAQASTDLIATGVLDYSVEPESSGDDIEDLLDADELLDIPRSGNAKAG